MIRRARNLQEGMGMTYRRRTVSFIRTSLLSNMSILLMQIEKDNASKSHWSLDLVLGSY